MQSMVAVLYFDTGRVVCKLFLESHINCTRYIDMAFVLYTPPLRNPVLIGFLSRSGQLF